MTLAYHAQNARNGRMAHDRMQREGVNMKGDRLWTMEEDAIVLATGANYAQLQKALPHRSYGALRARAQALGVAPKRHTWTGQEVTRLRRIYPTATEEELQLAFPGISITAIKSSAKHRGFRRARKPFKPTGDPVMDNLLQRCFEANLSMCGLDLECRTKSYFQKASWRNYGLNYNHIARALKVLDGSFQVEWVD